MYGPKNISEGFDGIPNNIDTAFVWSGNGKTYFVKGELFLTNPVESDKGLGVACSPFVSLALRLLS